MTQNAAGNSSVGPRIIAADLFCGAGGLTLGLERAGIEVSLCIDSDPKCEHPITGNTNAGFLQADIGDLPSDILKKAWEGADIRVLAGCAPCQPFSTYTSGRLSRNDPRWSLLSSFAHLVEQTKPHIVTMENVFKLKSHPVFEEFLEVLRRCGYFVEFDVLDCREFGIPQMRKRLVLIASFLGKPEMPIPTTSSKAQWRTVKQCIGDMPKIYHGETHASDPMHASSALSEINLRRIIASKPGGTWRDWPSELVAKCHLRDSGRTYPSVYGRMEWDEPAPTMTGQCFGFGNGRFGHPEQNRAISLREAAMLQSFPRNFSFVPRATKMSMKAIGLMIGNAVPPKLGEAIGGAILQHVEKSFNSLRMNTHLES